MEVVRTYHNKEQLKEEYCLINKKKVYIKDIMTMDNYIWFVIMLMEK